MINNNNNINNKNKIPNHKFWIYDPYILLDKNTLLDIWPKESMTREEKLNAISKFVIFTTIIGFFLFRNLKLLFTGIITLVIIIILYYILNKKDSELKETFSNTNLYQKYKHNYTNPDINNPLMNVLLPEIQDNNNRLPAAPSYNQAVEEKINNYTKDIVKNNFNDENVDDKLFNNLGDNFQFEQSMRQWHTMPNTTIPNNQKDFAKFCYGNTAHDIDNQFKSFTNN
tara:strand:+ start:5301 stop:5981 length:681 start_codon:yes stop_codon:yes gene_type:complete